MLLGMLEFELPSLPLSNSHIELARLAFYHFTNFFLYVMPVEFTIQCFIQLTGSLTMNRLKMVIRLLRNTTWHECKHTNTRISPETYTDPCTDTSKEKFETSKTWNKKKNHNRVRKELNRA